MIFRIAPEAPVTAGPAPPDEDFGRPHVATWILLGVSAAGLGVVAGLGGYSLSLEDCKPTRSDEEVDEIVAMRIGADVGLGVGAASGLAAVMVGVVSASSEAQEDPHGIGWAPVVGPTTRGLMGWTRF